ncbi:MAG: EpsI family protein [Sphingomonadaceae bacterium]|nr:EpsI family protein [Sphingomonadaceae bacterium]
MISRRDTIAGLACLAASGAAFALKPRNRLNLLGGAQLETLVPRSFAEWSEHGTGGLVIPSDNSLAARLYSQTVGRVFTREDGAEVMLLIAYGDTQSDTLQLHRPEICYPFFGFTITRNEAVPIPLANGVVLPGRTLTASTYDRNEQVLYWTRLGEYLPQDGREQLKARLRTQIHGFVADGILVRVSTLGDDAAAALALNREFVAGLMKVVPRQLLPALVGSEDATRLAV